MALITAVGVVGPAYAQTQTDENIKADVQALDKDNKELIEQRESLSKLRADKAEDKAKGETTKQALDSLKIGVNKMDIEKKEIEKHSDEKALEQHKEDSRQEDAAAKR